LAGAMVVTRQAIDCRALQRSRLAQVTTMAEPALANRRATGAIHSETKGGEAEIRYRRGFTSATAVAAPRLR
jgi:hypothetical protein